MLKGKKGFTVIYVYTIFSGLQVTLYHLHTLDTVYSILNFSCIWL